MLNFQTLLCLAAELYGLTSQAAPASVSKVQLVSCSIYGWHLCMLWQYAILITYNLDIHLPNASDSDNDGPMVLRDHSLGLLDIDFSPFSAQKACSMSNRRWSPFEECEKSGESSANRSIEIKGSARHGHSVFSEASSTRVSSASR